MQRILFLLFCILLLSGFSSKKPPSQDFHFQEVCNQNFKPTLLKRDNKVESLLEAYHLFSCHPVQVSKYVLKHHHKENWFLQELAKKRIQKDLSLEEELWLLKNMQPFLEHSSDKERYLTRLIDIKKKLNLDSSEETTALQKKFPSYDSTALLKPNLKVVKDLKRRGQNSKALEILLLLQNEDKNDLKTLRELVKTQKNIRRNQAYLKYSQNYVGKIYKNLKKTPKSPYYRDLYLREALLDIRRVWTYRSTKEALKMLTSLINNHCSIPRFCGEHYWIKGRIYEELKNTDRALYWYEKAVKNTSIKSNEFLNRVWNLSWLLYKVKGKDKALSYTKKYTATLEPKEISSKLYYWMSKWANEPKTKEIYKKSIRTYHPLSFYLWSDLALGEGMDLTYSTLENLPKELKKSYEKDLLKIIDSHYVSLAHSYIDHIEKQPYFKKNLNWKKLKALSGRYADLLLDLEAGLLEARSHIPFFFSRGFEQEATVASSRFLIPKELIWSITRQESNFNPYARSWADAFGLMQILPRRADLFIQDVIPEEKRNEIEMSPFKLYDPSFNMLIGAWLLKENNAVFNQKLPLAIAAYNASEKKVKEWEKRFYTGEWSNFIEEITYRETRKYVKLVLRNLSIYSKLEKESLKQIREGKKTSKNI